MEAIGESWLFAVFIGVLDIILITIFIRALRERRKTLINFSKEDRRVIQKEYRKNAWSNFKFFVKWFFHLK